MSTRFLLPGLVCFVIAFSACSDKEDVTNPTVDNIISLSATVPGAVTRGSSTTTATIKSVSMLTVLKLILRLQFRAMMEAVSPGI